MIFIIQGSKLDASGMEARIESFITLTLTLTLTLIGMEARIESFIDAIGLTLGLQSRLGQSLSSLRMEPGFEILDTSTFRKKQAALKSILATKDLTMQARSARIYREIASREYRFDRRAGLLEVVAKLTLNDLKDFYKRYLIPDTADRISIEIFDKKGPIKPPPLSVTATSESCAETVDTAWCPKVVPSDSAALEKFKAGLRGYPAADVRL